MSVFEDIMKRVWCEGDPQPCPFCEQPFEIVKSVIIEGGYDIKHDVDTCPMYQVPGLHRSWGHKEVLVGALNDRPVEAALRQQLAAAQARTEKAEATIAAAYKAAEEAGVEINPGMCTGNYSLEYIFANQVKHYVDEWNRLHREGGELDRSLGLYEALLSIQVELSDDTYDPDHVDSVRRIVDAALAAAEPKER